VSALIDYARCPKRFYWSTVRPLPRFSGPAARIGTQVHAWIERQSSGQVSLLEVEDAPDLSTEELTGEPGRVERLQQAFRDSRFADLVPVHAERPFLLRVGEWVVGGRIDAIFPRPDGGWEVVDYKTGRRPEADDPAARLQLDLYALACVEIWGRRPEDLVLTYLYLGTGEEDARPAGDPADIRARVLASLEAIAERRFDPAPGPVCRWCDFLAFCDPGRDFVNRTV
jgi:DNA helicase-2/ATP-dependent DNA helicase PcrA